MSLYGDNKYGEDLYAGPVEIPQQQEQPQQQQFTQVDPGEAVSKSLQLIANPAKLITDTFLPADPSESKLPFALAVVGACIAAIVLAAHFDKGGNR